MSGSIAAPVTLPILLRSLHLYKSYWTVNYCTFEIFPVYTLIMKICLIIFGQIFVIQTTVQWEEKWPWSAFENVLYLSIVGVAASNLQYMSSNKQCHYQVPNLKETCSWKIRIIKENTDIQMSYLLIHFIIGLS